MRPINQKAQRIMDILVERLKNGYAKTDNTKGLFMPLIIEEVGRGQIGKIRCRQISIAHYYKQNGDLMRDPEMVFLKALEGPIKGKYFPLFFQQDNLGMFQQAMKMNAGIVTGYYPRAYKDQRGFAAMWLNNIKEQQNL